MSTVTLAGGIDPEMLWQLGALPLALVADLALGDVPGRTIAVRWLDRLIGFIGRRTERLVHDLGGGRGGDLFSGAVLTLLVVGTATGLVWLLVDRADAVGGPVSLAVRTALIAGGLAIRVTGDCILLAGEATDRDLAGRWLATAGGHPPARLARFGVDPVAVASVGELISGTIIGPLLWLVIGGPAIYWGFIALRILRQTLQAQPRSSGAASRIPITLADLAEVPAAVVGLGLIGPAAALIRADPVAAWRTGWQSGRNRPLDVARWCQAGLAGALGVAIPGGRMFASTPMGSPELLGEASRAVDGAAIVAAVRIWQLVALEGAVCAVLVMVLLA